MNNFVYIETIAKKDYEYSLIESNILFENTGETKVYGIEISGNNEYSIAEDISTEKDDVSKLLELVAEEELFPVHLLEFIEDFLSCPNDYI